MAENSILILSRKLLTILSFFIKYQPLTKCFLLAIIISSSVFWLFIGRIFYKIIVLGIA